MSYEVFKILHITGVIMVFVAVGAALMKARLNDASAPAFKKEIGITHGAGLLLVLISGFGILIKLGLAIKGWVVVKFVIWLFFGGVTVIAALKRESAKSLWFICIVVGMIAAYMAILKPF